MPPSKNESIPVTLVDGESNNHIGGKQLQNPDFDKHIDELTVIVPEREFIFHEGMPQLPQGRPLAQAPMMVGPVHPVMEMGHVLQNANVVQTADVMRTAEIVHPAEVYRPLEAVHPAEVLRPVEVMHPAEVLRPAEVLKPVEVQPMEIIHPDVLDIQPMKFETPVYLNTPHIMQPIIE